MGGGTGTDTGEHVPLEHPQEKVDVTQAVFHQALPEIGGPPLPSPWTVAT
jgi:hypothetical protein